MKSSSLPEANARDPGRPAGVRWRYVLNRLLGRREGVSAGLPVHYWVRLALYLVLLVVGVLTFALYREQQQTETVRQGDAEIIRIAAAQGTQIQRMIMLLTRLQAREGSEEESVNALAETVTQTQTQAAMLDDLLARQGVWQIDDRPQLRSAIFDWQDRRERVWYRAQSLLWLVDQGDSAKRVTAIQFLQTELESFWLTTQALVDELQLAAQRRSRDTLHQIQWSVVWMGLALVLLIVLVAEPLVRFVRRQSAALVNQSAEVQRLALVAQRTSNWVAVVDRQRHLLWCNDAFLRGKGWTLEEALGQHAALLAANEYNDAEEMSRLFAELDMGLPVRAELMHRGRQGMEVWLDVDYQPIHDGMASTPASRWWPPTSRRASTSACA